MRQQTNSYSRSRFKQSLLLLVFSLSLLTQLGQSADSRANSYANDEKFIKGRGTKQISDINMLLPISACDDCRKVSYSISAINGCYQWEVSHPNLIEIKSIRSEAHPECSNIAHVKAVSTKPTKSLVWISAKDQYSGQVLRCEVKLGRIERLEVQTHLRQFYLNDYEHLHMAAYDQEGNIFSGLDGFRFEWTIDSGHQNVKMVTEEEASHTSSDQKKEYQFSNMQSNVLFLKGVKQGVSVVSTKISEPGYEDIDQTHVSLTITEPFVVIPQQTVYIAPTTRYPFQLAKVQLKNNDMSFSPIALPNRQYQWNVDDSSMGDIGEDGVFISKDKEGLVSILVEDTNIANNTAESSVRVVFPQLLDIEVSDITQQIVIDKLLVAKDSKSSFENQLNITTGWDNNWYLVQNHYYLFKVFIYDRDKHPIIMSENMLIHSSINPEYFDIVMANSLNSEVIVRAKKTTLKNQKIPLSFHLDSIRSQAPQLVYQVDKTRIRSEKDVTISQPLKIDHPTNLILLPVLKASDDSKNGEYWNLTAIGGSGVYHWSILNSLVATISGAGVVKSNEVGITTVVVRDVQNQRNFDSIQVEVTPIVSLQWLEDHLEIKKNSEEALLSLIALDKQGRKFTNCTGIEASFDLKGAGILSPLSTSHNYNLIKEYVASNRDLLDLKQRFDLHPTASFLSELKNTTILTDESLPYFTHNNFGICQQQRYWPHSEGLARIKAQLLSNNHQVGSSHVLETSFAEVAVYDSLVTKNPDYSNFFNSLYSKYNVQKEEIGFSKFITPNVFILSFGSSLLWQVNGGTNFWKDIPEKYQSTLSHQLLTSNGDVDKNALKSAKLSEQTAHFEFALQCNKPSTKSQMTNPHNFQVKLQQQNQVSKFLLRPASHEISIDIKCEPPRNLQLFWSQENNTLNQYQMEQLPSFRSFNQERHHYVLANSKHHIRYLILDEQQHAFFNHSSISTEVTSTNQAMAGVSLGEASIEQAIQNNDYDFRVLQVFNQTGSVNINAVARGYYTRFFREGLSFKEVEPLNVPQEVKDTFRLEIVKNVDVQPKYKSVYLSQENQYKFTINHGSGHFSVTINNTAVADRIYIDGERTVTIIPKREGPIEIRVEDIEIPESIVAISELLISDIKSLELDAPGTLIEQGSQMPLNVTAYDIYGNPFDLDQYEHMKFNIEIELTQQREKGLQTEADPNNRRKFIAKGFEPGNYQTAAFTFKYSPKTIPAAEMVRVSSEVLKIEVFPILEIQPNSLLLTPYMKYTLVIAGGPSRSVYTQQYHGGAVEINFKVQNDKIASVDKFREVTANQVGDTNLYYEIVQVRQSKSDTQRRTIVSSKTIPIRVRLATAIDVPFNDQRTVYSGSMIKLIAILKYNEETFTHGIAPISYSWNISNPSILHLNLPHKVNVTQVAHASTALVLSNKNIRDNEHNNNNAVFISHFNSSTIYTTGGKPGEAFVTLSLAIEYPDQYKSERNWFSKTVILRIKDMLSVGIPEFMNNPDKHTHLYLMPPNTYTKIETNRRTRLRLGYSQQSIYDYSSNSYQYKDSQSPIIQLVNEEGIRTSDKYGKVTVIIEENQAFNDQVVMLNVLITDIYSIATKDVYQALSFPLGSTMNIPIKFQNERGHQFANNIEGIEVGIELSHPRVLSAQLDEFNSTIQLKAEGSGECNVVVYLLKSPHIFDIFRVRVSSVVKPYSPVQVHVGGQIQFKIMDVLEHQPLATDTIWSSSQPSVLDINQRTGLARGLQEGKADILLSNNINAASIVQVSKVKYAEVDSNSRKNLVINTDETTQDVRVRLQLFLQDQQEELTPTVQFDGITLIKQNVGLHCETDSPNVLATYSQVDELEGFFCVLSYKNQGGKQIPRSAQVSVWIYGPNPADPSNMKTVLYREKLLTFDVSFLSRIRVETYYRNGINLFGDDRTASVQVFANSPFTAYIENMNEQDKGYELIKYKINKTSEASSEYLLTLTVPQEITHNFQSSIHLIHPVTNAHTIVPVNFENRVGRTVLSKVGQAAQRKIDALEDRAEVIRTLPATHNGGTEASGTLGSKLFQFLLITVFVGALISFILANFFKIDPVDFFKDIMNLRSPFRQRQQQPPRGRNPPGSLVRPSYGPSNFPMNATNSFAIGTSSSGAARQPQPLNLSRVDASVDSGKKFKNAMYSQYGGRS